MRVANVGKVVVSVCRLLLLQGAIARRCAFQLAPSRAGKPAVQREVLARSQDWRHGAAGDSASGVSDPVHAVFATRRHSRTVSPIEEHLLCELQLV